MKTVMSKIRLARIDKGYSQEYIAGKLGIAQKSYCKLERVQTKLTVERLQKIAFILDRDPSSFLTQIMY